MKKERLFYLDFIRAFATLAIVITHYNAWFLMFTQPPRPQMSIITSYVGNIYIGGFGVSLFLIISGAALMYVYDEKLDLKVFFWKRAKTIYPMYWIAFAIAFLYLFFRAGEWPIHAAPWTLILTVLGVDGLFCNVISNYFTVGEWFLGFIIFFYLLFPLLRFLIRKVPVMLAIASVVLYVASFFIHIDGLSGSEILTMRLPELVFGMFFVKYRYKVKWPVALTSLVVIIVNTIVAPTISEDLQTTYIGIASFLVLAFIANYIAVQPVRTLCSTICKYSYSIFICHHFIINQIVKDFDLSTIGWMDNIVLFVGCCVVIGVVSWILYHLNKGLTEYVKRCFAKLQG